MYKIFKSLFVVLGLLLIVTIVYFIFFCRVNNNTLFKKLSPSVTNIHFSNNITYNNLFNIYTYNNFYNGGGVAIGDVNNDGLPDIYLTANQGKNKLCLNEGNFHFKDITNKAGVAGTKPWSTGVSMVDINGDGLLDIYVCNAGLFKGKKRENELFINQGVDSKGIPHFKEEASKFGIADSGFSTQAYFFDYDHDGDPDMYLVNYSPKSINSFNLRDSTLRTKVDYNGGDRLYRNNLISTSSGSLANQKNKRNGQIFTDVTKQAGTYSNAIGLGLGATVGDINGDGWMDIYVSNDFFERDYLYINNKDGTFREVLRNQMSSISNASMSGDMADLNHDGYPEIFIVDMLPHNQKRLKTLTDFIGWDRYQALIKMGYYKQFKRNMLHLNNGDGTFSEIGRYAGIDATDWSWGGLIADFNLDGRRDIFVPNGIYKDLDNKDVLISFIRNRKEFIKNGHINYKELIQKTPSNPTSNYMFKNNGDFTFTNKAKKWGLGEPGFSNGAAYGDLDRDGDLDLVINNVNMPVFIYKNQTIELYPDRSWLEVKLEGKYPNTLGIGAKVELSYNGQHKYAQQMLQRGFQSSVDPVLHLGFKRNIDKIDTVKVHWSNGQISLKTDVKTGQILVVKQGSFKKDTKFPVNTISLTEKAQAGKQYLTNITVKMGFNWKHKESSYNDFKHWPLLYHMRSAEGPPLCTGDINNDRLEDFYVGGAAGQPGALFIQEKNGGFDRVAQPALEADRNAEDTDCIFFNNGGMPELYVASGSDEFPTKRRNYADRLYKLNTQGKLIKLKDALPKPEGGYKPSSVVCATDLNGDGDLDLFVGSRMNPVDYGLPVGGRLLINIGDGQFKDMTDQLAPQLLPKNLKSAGITDAAWGDLNGDSQPDLVIVGEWMPITILYNKNGHLQEADPNQTKLNHTNGWWQSVTLADLNGDGKLDIVAGNFGLNTKWRATPNKPVEMWVGDFDHNGTIGHILSTYTNGNGPYPIALRQNLIQQLPYLKSRYPTFSSYAEKTIDDIFTQNQLDDVIHYQAGQFASVISWNQENGSFRVDSLPFRVQLTPVYSILAEDINGDNIPELILGGNLSSAKPQMGPYNASYGTILQQDSSGIYHEISDSKSGFFVRGEIRDIKAISSHGKKLILVARNNSKIKIFKLNSIHYCPDK
jgi:hypothetical protein